MQWIATRAALAGLVLAFAGLTAAEIYRGPSNFLVAMAGFVILALACASVSCGWFWANARTAGLMAAVFAFMAVAFDASFLAHRPDSQGHPNPFADENFLWLFWLGVVPSALLAWVVAQLTTRARIRSPRA